MSDNKPSDEPRPGNFDKAWNDPPLFSYSSTSATTSGDGPTKLNKRVGMTFGDPPPSSKPLTTEAAPPIDADRLHDAGAKPTIANMPLPPPPGQGPPLAPPRFHEAPKVTSNEEETPSLNVKDITEAFETFLSGSGLPAQKEQEIAKRIAIMEKKWESDELNDHVRQGVGAIVAHLKAEDYKAAEKAQVSLIVDWPDQCGNWVVGIKHLIAQLKQSKSQ